MPLSIEAIQKQFDDAGIHGLNSDRNLELLAGTLQDNEIIEAACSGGKMEENTALIKLTKHAPVEVGNGIMVATNVRVLYVKKGMMWGGTQESLDYTEISSMQQTGGMLANTIEFFSPGKMLVHGAAFALGGIMKEEDAAKFITTIEQKMRESRGAALGVIPNIPNQNDGPSKVEELRELAKLKKDGIINDDEFKQMKKKILKS